MLFCKHPDEAAVAGHPQFARVWVWHGTRYYCGWCEDVGRYRTALEDMVKSAEDSYAGICGEEAGQLCGRCQVLRNAQIVLSEQETIE